MIFNYEQADYCQRWKRKWTSFRVAIKRIQTHDNILILRDLIIINPNMAITTTLFTFHSNAQPPALRIVKYLVFIKITSEIDWDIQWEDAPILSFLLGKQVNNPHYTFKVENRKLFCVLRTMLENNCYTFVFQYCFKLYWNVYNRLFNGRLCDTLCSVATYPVIGVDV